MFTNFIVRLLVFSKKHISNHWILYLTVFYEIILLFKTNKLLLLDYVSNYFNFELHASCVDCQWRC